MSKESKGKISSIGGQALMEGVMMRGKTAMAMTVRTESGDILTETKRLKPRGKIARIPIIRGMVAFVDSLISGTGCTLRSAEVIYPEEETPSRFMFGIAALIGVLLAVVLFIAIPSLITSLFDKYVVHLGILLSSVMEGVLRIAIFLTYLALVSKMKDIRRTFMYHGAEHRTINCYESGKELTVENVQSCSTRHNRCGTTFLFIVIITSILIFSLVTYILSLLGWTNIGTFGKVGIRILLLPFVAGISYEVLKLLAKLPDNKFAAILRAPGLALQALTTKIPDDDMAAIAITSFKLVMEMDEHREIAEHKFGEMTMLELKTLVRNRLVKAGVEEEAEVDWLIAVALNKARGELLNDVKIDYKQYSEVDKLLCRREKGVPLDYIVGYSEFYGVKVKVNDNVLIPRLDTEFVADVAIKLIGNNGYKVLDLMTGSGCIAAAIASNTNATVTASDISTEALELARDNLDGKNVEVVRSDCFNGIDGVYDVIVSNPPYIKSAEIDKLQREVKCQPRIALDGGEDGLKFYRLIAQLAPHYLTSNGTLILEIGYDQAREVSSLLEENFTDVTVRKDYSGNDRVIIAKGRKL